MWVMPSKQGVKVHLYGVCVCVETEYIVEKCATIVIMFFFFFFESFTVTVGLSQAVFFFFFAAQSTMLCWCGSRRPEEWKVSKDIFYSWTQE